MLTPPRTNSSKQAMILNARLALGSRAFSRASSSCIPPSVPQHARHPCTPRGDHAARQCGVWREDIERMEATRPDMQLGVPTGVPQGVRIGDGLVPEYL